MIESFNLANAVCIFALIVASLTDLKTREVPDWISYSLIIFSIGNSSILSIFYQNSSYFINATVGATIGLIIGLFMFYAGQWGGADSKLTIGICSILGLTIPLFSNIHSQESIAIFVLNTLIVGAIYGIFYTLILGISNYKIIKNHIESNYSSKLFIFFRSTIFIIFLLSSMSKFIYKDLISFSLMLISGAGLAIIYTWMLVTSVEKTQMIKKIPVSKLTEGDWVVEEVSKNGKLIYLPSKTGIDKENIEILKKEGIISVTIKEGIPFVPSLLIAFIITITLGNWLIRLL